VINSSHQPCHNENEQKGIAVVVDDETSISIRGSKVCHKKGVPGKVSEVGYKIGCGFSFLTCVAVEWLVVQRLHLSHQWN
jgi:hypothetical protein